MIWLVLSLLLFAEPFWQIKPPAEWNDIELSQFLSDSPWAQMAAEPGKAKVGKNAGQGQVVQVYLATAAPIAKAVAERERRAELRRPGSAKALADDPMSEERSAWFADNRQSHIIVAARVGLNDAFSDGAETRRLEQDSVMELGRRGVKLSAYFPPTRSDPYLYLAFPREPATSSGKTITFDLYLPGVPVPYRIVVFTVKDMLVDGKLEM
jgi:hypothetical protein